MKNFVLSILICAVLLSCKKLIQYHPDEVRPSLKELNITNIGLIEELPAKTTFSFIVISDLQRFYEDLEDLVEHINTLQHISFVMIGGDITDFGLNREYNLVVEELIKLRVPYLTAIGNHDMLANGKLIFNKMFGPENYSFKYGPDKFIVFNSNSREVGFDGTVPDMDWLRSVARPSASDRSIFFLSHVPPFSADFDKNLETGYTSFVSGLPNARLSIHGHEHHFMFGMPYNDGIPYVIAPAISQRNFVQVIVDGAEVSVQQKSF